MPKSKVAKTCPQCGLGFLTRNATYCSRACGILAHYDQAGRKLTKSFQGTCAECGETFHRKYANGRRTCGRKCAMALRTREAKGVRRREQSHLWKGGLIRKGAYLREYAPDHPNCDQKGYVAQHRLVMERHIGRLLEDWEKVHHRNGVKTQNDIANLEIVTHARPNGVVICPHCRKSFQVH